MCILQLLYKHLHTSYLFILTHLPLPPTLPTPPLPSPPPHSMAMTPFLDKLGTDIAGVLEKGNALPGGLVISQAGKKAGSVTSSSGEGPRGGGGRRGQRQEGKCKSERRISCLFVATAVWGRWSAIC